MTTFAEEVYHEVYKAAVGATRLLSDVEYVKSVIYRNGETRWVSAAGDVLTDVGMYEATLRG